MSQSPAWRVFDGPQDAAAATNAAGSAGAGSVGANAPGGTAADRRLALAGLAGAAAIGAVALVVAMSGTGTTTIEGPETGLAAFPTGSAAALLPGGEVVVDVAGAVVNPGLYRLGTGARVGDAIEAAGGFSPRVDVDRVGIELNLAATVTDGAQIRVPSRDDPSPPPAAGGGGSGSSGGGGSGGGGGGAGGGLVNLNTATESELDTLPGIGPVTAAKIIEARATEPFRTVEELRERGIVGEKTFENLKALVTVG